MEGLLSPLFPEVHLEASRAVVHKLKYNSKMLYSKNEMIPKLTDMANPES